MDQIFCEFCKKIFLNKLTLKNHITNSKACIKLRNENNDEIKCEHCNKTYYSVYTLERHYKTCKKNPSNNTEKEYTKLKNENNKLKEELKEIIKLKYIEEKYKDLEEKYNSLFQEYSKITEKNRNTFEDSVKTISTLATKAIDKAGGNKIYNKYIQNLIPLTDEHLKEQSKNLQLRHIVDGPDSLAHFASTHSLRDRVICTDVARRNFVFKDESNNIIKDPKGVKITKKFVDNNKEELTRLLKEYAKSYYDDDTVMTLKEKQELEELLLAIKYCNDPDNADSYNRFEKQFTNCFGKLMFNKNYENLELEEKE
jgi:hypothetical protein